MLREAYHHLFLLVFVLGIDIYLGHRELLPVPAFVLFFVMAAPLVVPTLLRLVMSGGVVVVIRRTVPVLLPFLLLIALAGFGTLVPLNQEGAQSLKYALLPVMDFLTLWVGILLAIRKPRVRYWRKQAEWLLYLQILAISVDVMYPGTLSKSFARAAGFMLNPNAGGFLTVLLLAGALTWSRRRAAHDAVLIVLGAAATIATLSRSSLLLLAVVCASWLLRIISQLDVKTSLRLLMLGGVIALVAISATSVIVERLAMLNEAGGSERRGMFSGERSMVSADEPRLSLMRESAAMIAEHPMVGRGTGYSYSMEVGPHNIYLAKCVDNGLLAAPFILSLIGGVWWLARGSKNARMLVYLAAINGMFSHTLLDERHVLLLIGVAVVTGISARQAEAVASPYDPRVPRRLYKGLRSPVSQSQLNSMF